MYLSEQGESGIKVLLQGSLNAHPALSFASGDYLEAGLRFRSWMPMCMPAQDSRKPSGVANSIVEPLMQDCDKCEMQLHKSTALAQDSGFGVCGGDMEVITPEFHVNAVPATGHDAKKPPPRYFRYCAAVLSLQEMRNMQ